MLRHAQGVVVCLALVTSFGDFLNSSEGDRKMVAIVPATSNYRRARMHSSEAREKLEQRAYLTGRLRFFSKSNVVSNASSLPAAFLNALVQRVLRGLYLIVMMRIYVKTQAMPKRTTITIPKTYFRWNNLRHFERQNLNVCKSRQCCRRGKGVWGKSVRCMR